ncbi:membrane protein [Oceanisphaera marina]|uniref:Membrane protein n=1 Tax=Oceanisphaera marina TaxID=2017550 RepID=A0ABQ1IP87_9GAMM|nr:hypothetical protein [Oceanisphaera marina]GGB46335.1 membrane protein [Oceanisphaera marina]
MTVKQRQVFYIHGFDPRGASHYHRLYRSQAAQQAPVNGLHINVSARRRNSSHHHQWQLSTAHTQSQYHYLGWDDIVRQHWGKGWRQIISDFYCFFMLYIANGNVIKFAKASRQQLIAGLYPALYLLLGISVSGLLAYRGASIAYHSLPPSHALPSVAAYGLSLITAVLILLISLHGVKKVGSKLAVFWLQRIYAFSGKWAQGTIPELDTRSQQFAEHIIRAINNPENDEIVIIAHSVGTMMVIPTLAQVLSALPQTHLSNNKASNKPGNENFANQRVVLITLGQCIPLISFQPKATQFRAQLQQLGQDPRLTWLDYTAPTDGACFPLLDPITSCGLTKAPHAGPRLLSPRFFTLYHAARYKKLRRAWYTMHFLYLMATDKPGPYDFFAFTAGPKRVVDHINAPFREL